MMRKILYIVTFIVMIIALIIPFKNVDKEVDVKTIEKVIVKQMDTETMQKQDEKALKRGYKVKMNDYQKQYSYGPISYMNVEEITVFYETNEEKRNALLKKAEEHIKSQISVFEGYGEVQTKLLKKSYVKTKGNYVICIVAKNVHSIAQAFESLF